MKIESRNVKVTRHFLESELGVQVDRGLVLRIDEVVDLIRSLGQPLQTILGELRADAATTGFRANDDTAEIPSFRTGIDGR